MPLTVAENAAELKRQERKQKKAERRKAEKENSQPEQPLQQTETDHSTADSDATAVGAAGEHAHTNGHASAGNDVIDGSPQLQQAGKSSKARKQRKSGETKRPLHDDEQLSLTVAQLKTIVAAANEKVVRECCKQMTHLSAKQRKELQDSLTKEHASTQSSSLYQTLYSSSVVQAAMRQREASEQADTDGQTVGTTGDVEGSVAADVSLVED